MKSNTVRLILKTLATIPRSAAQTSIGEIRVAPLLPREPAITTTC